MSEALFVHLDWSWLDAEFQLLMTYLQQTIGGNEMSQCLSLSLIRTLLFLKHNAHAIVE